MSSLDSIPPFSQNRGDIKYIKFEILQIVSPSEDVKFSNVRGLYLRKYGKCLLLFSMNIIFGNLLETFEIFTKKMLLDQKLPISLLLSALVELDA